MNLHQMLKVKTRSKKRLGRGIGSGKGKTAGRGTKGQKARGTIPIGFTGNLPLYKKLPLKRGKGNPSFNSKPKIIQLSQLNILKDKTVVDIAKLIDEKIILAKDAKRGVKILDNGEIKTALTIKLPISKTARLKVEKAGGKVEDA